MVPPLSRYHDKAWARSIEATADLTNGFGVAYRYSIEAAH